MTCEETLALKAGDLIETTTGKIRVVSYARNCQLRDAAGKLVIERREQIGEYSHAVFANDPNKAYVSTRGCRNGKAFGASKRYTQDKIARKL